MCLIKSCTRQPAPNKQIISVALVFN